MKTILAQSERKLPGLIKGLGDFGAPRGSAPTIFANLITKIIGILTVIAGVYFFFIFITGAIAWIGAGGDKGAIEDARGKVTSGLIGLAIVIFSIFLVDIVGKLLGFSDILDPAAIIPSLSP